jgi:integrase
VVNPLAKVSKLEARSSHAADIISVPDVIKLLSASSEEFIPFLTIGLFTGARVSEIQRLTWDLVDFDKGTILFPKEITKTNIPKEPEILSNLAAWLEPFKGRTGKIVSSTERLRIFRKGATRYWQIKP